LHHKIKGKFKNVKHSWKDAKMKNVSTSIKIGKIKNGKTKLGSGWLDKLVFYALRTAVNKD
jgi:hypothetical protein